MLSRSSLPFLLGLLNSRSAADPPTPPFLEYRAHFEYDPSTTSSNNNEALSSHTPTPGVPETRPTETVAVLNSVPVVSSPLACNNKGVPELETKGASLAVIPRLPVMGKSPPPDRCECVTATRQHTDKAAVSSACVIDDVTIVVQGEGGDTHRAAAADTREGEGEGIAVGGGEAKPVKEKNEEGGEKGQGQTAETQAQPVCVLLADDNPVVQQVRLKLGFSSFSVRVCQCVGERARGLLLWVVNQNMCRGEGEGGQGRGEMAGASANATISRPCLCCWLADNPVVQQVGNVALHALQGGVPPLLLLLLLWFFVSASTCVCVCVCAAVCD